MRIEKKCQHRDFNADVPFIYYQILFLRVYFNVP